MMRQPRFAADAIFSPYAGLPCLAACCHEERCSHVTPLAYARPCAICRLIYADAAAADYLLLPLLPLMPLR